MTYEQLFKEIPIIPTPNHILRGLIFEDVEEIYALYRQYPVSGIQHREDAWHMVGRVFDDYKNRKAISWGIMSRATNTLQGECGFSSIDTVNHLARLTYSCPADSDNAEVSFEIINSLLLFGYRRLSLNRIDVVLPVNEVVGIKTMYRLGFTREACLRQYLLAGERYQDAFLMSQLQGEWALSEEVKVRS